jgi:hypothetical protein
MCVVVAVVLAVFSSPASAAQTRPYTGVSFGPDGVGGTESFQRVQGVALDPGSGDVYVYDGEAGKVYKFDSAGAPADFSVSTGNVIEGVGGGAGGAEEEIAVAPAGSPGGTAGDIYVANNSEGLQVYGANGIRLGEIEQGGETCGVATNPSGHLFVGVYGSTINEFTPSTNPPTAADKTGTGTMEIGLCNVAVDSVGKAYGANFGGNGLYRLESLGDATPVEVDPAAATMAIAPVSNDLYADRGNQIAEYSPTGVLEGTFAVGEISESRGVAVNAAATKVYVGASTSVRIYGSTVVVPDVETEAATSVTKASATLHGEIGAAGAGEAECRFEYTTRSLFESDGFSGASQLPCMPGGKFSGTALNSVTATANGLVPRTEYVFRVVGTNGNGENGAGPDTFLTPEAVAVETDAATGIGVSSATLNGTINPEGVAIENCAFEYGFEPGTYTHVLACAESPAEIGDGTAAIPVHAEAVGLEGATAYYFRLVASNLEGEGRGQEMALRTGGPGLAASFVSEISTSSVALNAVINPRGSPTTYHIDLVSAAKFAESEFANAIEVPVGGNFLGESEEEIEVQQVLEGLDPGSTYVAAVVASNGTGTVFGEPVHFKTFSVSAPALPDDRAYEQVSPVDKNAAPVQGYEGVSIAATGGNAVGYYETTGDTGLEGAAEIPIYLALRGGTGWESKGVNLPATLAPINKVLGYTRDLSGTYNAAYSTGGGGVLYFRSRDGTLKTIATFAKAAAISTTAIASESADESEVLLESPAKLTTDAIEGTSQVDEGFTNLYLWDKTTDQLKLVSLLEGGEAAAEGAFAGAYHWTESETTMGGGLNLIYRSEALASNGSRVFFTTRSEFPALAQIYVREDPLSGSATTVQVSKSQKTNGTGPGGRDPNGPRPAKYLQATPDGAYVFFKSASELTNDANTGENDEGEDLYRYDVATRELIDLVPEAGLPEGAKVAGLAGISGDASYVYFVSRADLPSTGATGTNNKIYVWHNGTIRLVFDGVDRFIAINTQLEGGALTERQKEAQVTPNGEALVFISEAVQPGFNNRASREIFRYSYGDDETTCISCNPASATAEKKEVGGGRFLQLPAPLVHAQIWNHTAEPHNISLDGRRVVFQSSERLVGADHNFVNDVYEWEEPDPTNAHDTCTAASPTYISSSGGCLFLISGGEEGAEPSYLADSDGEAVNIFFFTSQSLVGQDKDELVDLYDARVGGGIASQNPPPPSVPCESDAACQGPESAGVAGVTPGSSTFVGPGNAAVTKCKKGYARRRGKCVRKRAHHGNQPDKRHHKKKSKEKKSRSNLGAEGR